MFSHAQIHARTATSAGARVLLALLLAGLALAAPASAVIVFECSDNLCRINPDGSGRAQITTDGSPTNDYHWPSLSRDGTRMSWIRHGGLFLGDASGRATAGPMTNLANYQAIRPDGGQVAALEWGVDLWGDPTTYVKVHNPDGSIAISGVHPDDPSFGWTPGGRLLLPWNNEGTPTVGICIVSASTTNCDERVASDPASSLADPVVSPDGRLLAVSVKARSSDPGGLVALYDMTSHARVRALTNGTQDTNIAWSPDGSRLVFQRGMSLYTVAVAGTPGSETLLTNGETPSWGGSDPVTPAPGPSPPAPTPPTPPSPGPRTTAASFFRMPSNRRCLRRPARLRIAYLRPAGLSVRALRVRIGKRRTIRRSGAAARRSLTLTRLGTRPVKVTLRITTTKGAVYTATRTYRVCR